jgi:hypothetical protein
MDKVQKTSDVVKLEVLSREKVEKEKSTINIPQGTILF